jgi:hypothetical protein
MVACFCPVLRLQGLLALHCVRRDRHVSFVPGQLLLGTRLCGGRWHRCRYGYTSTMYYLVAHQVELLDCSGCLLFVLIFPIFAYFRIFFISYLGLLLIWGIS